MYNTVAAALNAKRDELYSLINQNKIQEARNLAINICNAGNIKDVAAAGKARAVFASGSVNKFLSTLMTYMTCMKVS